MNNTKKLLIGLLSITSLHNYTYTEEKELRYDFNAPEKKIVIVIPSYNNIKWLTQCLGSVKAQCYNNFEVIYINDCSTDRTKHLTKKYIKHYDLENKFKLISNEKRVGALANLYKAIHSCQNEDIIVLLDGDDWLAHPFVLKIINSVYQDPNVWLTYGQFMSIPECTRGFCREFSDNIILNNYFRKTHFPVSHLRTFYAGLFKLIKFKDLIYEGDFYQMTWDKAIMLPMIEMARERHKYIEDVLYHYNNSNPLNDHKVDQKLQMDLHHQILSKKPYHKTSWENIINAATKIQVSE
ncbi:glycosyltransferase family 2 protein [Candidatus Dependentiae bacterium]